MTALLLISGFLAGLIGALTGLGGGVVLVPLLTIVFGLPLQQAVGASLFAVIATSLSASSRFERLGYINWRVAIVLQLAASTGVLVGGLLISSFSSKFLFILFSFILFYTVISSFLQSSNNLANSDSLLAQKLKLARSYKENGMTIKYFVAEVPISFCVMFVAGILSALLGIGSGIFKVLAMDKLMKLPFRVSTATSNFMIGLTASTGAGFYLLNDIVPKQTTILVVLGVLVGARLGANLVNHLPVKILRGIFAGILAIVAVQMFLKGL